MRVPTDHAPAACLQNPSKVQDPAKVDAERVKASLPYGEVTVTVTKGGLDVPDEDGRDSAVIASAAIVVSFDLP